MALFNEFGEVESILCRELPQLETVSDGEAVTLNTEDRLDAVAYPDNCPRSPRFDPAKPLGCLSCVQAISELTDGMIVTSLRKSPLQYS